MDVCFGSCNLKSSDNQYIFMINQLKREIEDLKTTGTARLLFQDGKIAETCVYIKNNLSNELRTLLDSMKLSGELDDIITKTLLAEIDELQEGVFPLGHIYRCGGVGNGEVDDTDALIQAGKDANENGMTLIIPQGKFRITRDVDLRYIQVIKVDGDLICENGAVITVGGDSENTFGAKMDFCRVTNLKIVGLRSSLLTFKWCDNLYLHADGDNKSDYSTAYNIITGAYCGNVIFSSVGNQIGWINENTFNIRRVKTVTIDGNYDHNNNHFEHCNLEGGTLNLLNARNNTFSFRGEGGLTINTTEKSTCNLLEREFYYNHYFADTIDEYDGGTFIYNPINKLQTEHQLYLLDKNNKKFRYGSLYFNSQGEFNGVDYNEIYRTERIPIDTTFAIISECDQPVLRVQANFYDENGNKIIDTTPNFYDGRLKYLGADSEWSYQGSVNTKEDRLTLFKGRAKYVEFRLIFGNNVANTSCQHISITLLKLPTAHIYVSCNTVFNTTNQLPTKGYWNKGDKLYSNSVYAGGYAGFICVESGETGVWRNYGTIQE